METLRAHVRAPDALRPSGQAVDLSGASGEP